jgi:hypothetical protein
MKKILINLICIYQKTPLHTHIHCRFIPTCSEYTKIAIERFGTIKGSYLGIKRIIRCHPGGSSGIDMVPTKENK